MDLRFPLIETNHDLYFIQFEAFTLQKLNFNTSEDATFFDRAGTIINQIDPSEMFVYSTRVNELNDTIRLPLRTTPKEETAASFSEESVKKTARVIRAATDIGQGGLRDALAAEATEQATNFLGSEAKNIISSLAGKAINEQMQVFYEGPQRRSYSFEFTLISKSYEEAVEARRIARRLHYYASPSIPENSNLFFDYPNLIKFKFFRKDENSYMRNMFQSKYCYLENVSVEYGDGTFSEFVDDFQRAEAGIITISIQLKEIEYHTKADFQDTNGAI